jgi:hypothetical protein
MVIRAASTIASESRLGCERTTRDAWEEDEPGMSLPSDAMVEEVEAGGSAGASLAESNMWLTTEIFSMRKRATKGKKRNAHSFACTGFRTRSTIMSLVLRKVPKKSLPCSFCRRHVGPSRQSGLSATVASRRPFFRSRIHQSLSPNRSTSAAHTLQIRWRGASRPGSGPGGTLWTSTNRSSSISGANLRGCDRIYCMICKGGGVKQAHFMYKRGGDWPRNIFVVAKCSAC